VGTQLNFLQAGQFRSVLFTGHRGCGKSTELQRLKKDWEKPYLVLYVESNREIDSKDADYTEGASNC
jgi:predicted AAA+ superfamily ATPase